MKSHKEVLETVAWLRRTLKRRGCKWNRVYAEKTRFYTKVKFLGVNLDLYADIINFLYEDFEDCSYQTVVTRDFGDHFRPMSVTIRFYYDTPMPKELLPKHLQLA